MIEFLKKPYPYTERNKVFIVNIFISLFVFLFLYFFQPFELNTLPKSILLKETSIYGGLTFVVCLFFSLVFPFIFPMFYNEDKWNIGREILHITLLIVFIAIANYFYSVSQDYTPFNFSAFLSMLGSTISIGGIIVIAVVSIEANQALKKNLLAAQTMSAKIEQQPTVNLEKPIELNQLVHLPSEVEKQSLDIALEKFLYLTSIGNYIECYYLNDSNKIVSSKIRNRMKIIEPILEKYPDLFRCHRAFIVNMNYVKSIDGNAKGYTLILKETDVLIPVARSKSANLKEKFA